MALTPEDVRKLTAPFPLAEHEWRQGRNNKDYVYITETAVISRLNEVDPSWTFIVTDRTEREYTVNRKNAKGEAYTLFAHELAITGSLTVKGVTRYGIGMAEVAPDAAEADKSAVTDALKRAARLFGIGAYLLNDPPGKAQFPQWLQRQAAQVDKTTGEITQPEPPIEPPPAPAANGWTRAQADSLITEAHNKGVTTEEVLGVLGVKRISEYPGGFGAARSMLAAYAKDKPKTPKTEPQKEGALL